MISTILNYDRVWIVVAVLGLLWLPIAISVYRDHKKEEKRSER